MTILPKLEQDLFNAATERLSDAVSPARSARRLPHSLASRTVAHLPVLVSIIVALVVAAAALIALGRAHTPSEPAARPAHQTDVRSRSAPIFAPAFLLRHYAVLRSPERPDMKQVLKHLRPRAERTRASGGRLGLDLAMARVATPVPGGRTRVWLIPGRSGDCVFVDVSFGGGYGSCGPALRGSPEKALLPGACDSPSGEIAAGFVPDGNRTVTATLADGRTVTTSVHDNAFLLETSNSSFVNLLVRTVSGNRVAVPFGSHCVLG